MKWLKINWKRHDLKILSILSVFVFGGARFVASFARGAQRVPGETRAFDTGGEFADAGEDFQATQVILFGFGVEVTFDHPAEYA
jgi:hypothetical protein